MHAAQIAQCAHHFHGSQSQCTAYTDTESLETRSSATAKSTARPSCLVGVLYESASQIGDKPYR